MEVGADRGTAGKRRDRDSEGLGGQVEFSILEVQPEAPKRIWKH